MSKLFRKVTPILLAAVCAFPILTTGCAVHARVYDPYYHDYHGWNGEIVYYNQWEHDTHRDHRDFDKRSDDEKRDYWNWRHSHEDHH